MEHLEEIERKLRETERNICNADRLSNISIAISILNLLFVILANLDKILGL